MLVSLVGECCGHMSVLAPSIMQGEPPCVSAAADRVLLRTESMPARELASPRGRSTGRSRTAADLLKPGPAGVAKTLGSPRPIMRSASVRRLNSHIICGVAQCWLAFNFRLIIEHHRDVWIVQKC